MESRQPGEHHPLIHKALLNEERLAKALFERQESILPEGERWEEVEDQHSYYRSSARAVIEELGRLIQE